MWAFWRAGSRTVIVQRASIVAGWVGGMARSRLMTVLTNLNPSEYVNLLCWVMAGLMSVIGPYKGLADEESCDAEQTALMVRIRGTTSIRRPLAR
jgi:hypothetical protein